MKSTQGSKSQSAMRAVIYTRVSPLERSLGDKTVEDLRKLQHGVCMGRVAELGATIVGEYHDEDLPESVHRVELDSMMDRLLNDRDVDVVIVDHFDTLARNVGTRHELREFIRRAGSKLTFASEADEPSMVPDRHPLQIYIRELIQFAGSELAASFEVDEPSMIPDRKALQSFIRQRAEARSETLTAGQVSDLVEAFDELWALVGRSASRILARRNGSQRRQPIPLSTVGLQ